MAEDTTVLLPTTTEKKKKKMQRKIHLRGRQPDLLNSDRLITQLFPAW